MLVDALILANHHIAAPIELGALHHDRVIASAAPYGVLPGAGGNKVVPGKPIDEVIAT